MAWTGALAPVLLMLSAGNLASAASAGTATNATNATAAPAPAALLASSKSVKAGVDARQRRLVLQRLAALQFRPAASAISAAQLEAARDASFAASPPGSDKPLPEVDVAASRRPLARPPLQSQIPFGIWAIVWGVRHPGQAWRLFLPIPAATDRTPPDLHASAACRMPRAATEAESSCG